MMLIEYSITDISIRFLWKSNHKLKSIHVNFFFIDDRLFKNGEICNGMSPKKTTTKYNTK